MKKSVHDLGPSRCGTRILHEFFQIRGHLFSSAGLDVTDVSFILSRSGPSANGTYILRGKKLMLGMKHAFTHTSF